MAKIGLFFVVSSCLLAGLMLGDVIRGEDTSWTWLAVGLNLLSAALNSRNVLGPARGAYR